MVDIYNVVSEIMGPLCREYGLRIVKLEPDTILLLANSYAIYIFCDRPDVHIEMRYIDIPSDITGEMKYYSLDGFLASKRRIPLSLPDPVEDPIYNGVRWCTQILLADGQDILKGDKRWIKDYHWPVERVWPKLEATIRQLLA